VLRRPFESAQYSVLSRTDKKKALENLEQDAHQLITANNEGMAPENDRATENEPKLDEVVKAQQQIGEKPKNNPNAMKRAARETVEMEDFKSDLDALRIKRAAFEEQLSKGDGNARSLQDQLREIDAQIVALEGAAAKDNTART
jgi:hypothetical protein